MQEEKLSGDDLCEHNQRQDAEPQALENLQFRDPFSASLSRLAHLRRRWPGLRRRYTILSAEGAESIWAPRTIFWQLAFAAIVIAVAGGVRVWLLEGLDNRFTFITFYPAVIVAAMFGRAPGGSFAALLSVMAVNLWIAPVRDDPSRLGLLSFLAGAAFIIGLVEALHIMRKQAFAAALENAERRRSEAELIEREARLRVVVEGAVDGIINIDECGVVHSFNPAAIRIFGYQPEEIIGRNVKMLMPDGYRREHDGYIANYLRTGVPKVIGVRREVEGLRKDGSIFPLELGVGEVRLGDKRLFIGSIRDITERKKAEEALRASEDFSRTVLESSADCIKVMDSAGRIEFINEPGLRLMETQDAAMAMGQPWPNLWPEETRPLVRAAIDRALAGEIGHFSAFCPTDTGTPKWWDVLVAPVRNSEGRIQKFVSTARDITEAREAEEQIKLLMGEVNHRAKNLLAVVQAVARQTAGEEDPKIFAERLGERIAALAASHDLLVRSEWRGVNAGDLVRSQLAHFKDIIGTRVVLKGPAVRLKPAAAQALGMALHELATNAGKHGALSNAKGQVRVEWEIAKMGKEPRFQIRWAEEGGPPPSLPQRCGFGHTVMVDMAKHSLDADVTLRFDPPGLVWELSAAAGRAIESGEGSRQ